ncbi:hypothetical protein [Allorhizobium taibaishanense]|uniref:Uncharacterized protein n=2 Tax=Allorhizobium taibaishanense TaxID=887144 RepID=A0A7W6HP65_9HYPH|nr:hypothetical protein [Allorhizobium taibaishanense]MBB4008446.1 hypothetical protein [Allorhizobium taibaishanense]
MPVNLDKSVRDSLGLGAGPRDDVVLERLMKERIWTFGKAGTKEVFAPQLGLESGGWLRGYSHPNEHSWRVKGGAVELLNQNNTVSTRFDHVKLVDGRLQMEGRFRLPGEASVHYLHESGARKLPDNRTALIVPIHDAYFIYGINLLFQSMGADYDVVFVFSTDADRLQFRQMHQASAYLSYTSIVLSDYFSASALSVVAEQRTWPTIKKFLALALIHQSYDYIHCVDAETYVLNPTGWTQASEAIASASRWYGGTLTANHTSERQIMYASSVLLAPIADHENIQTVSGNWAFYTWWWDLPVYVAKSVPGFLEWIGWDMSLQFVERLVHSVFDHITYQFYMALHGGFSFTVVEGMNHALEFSTANLVSRVHKQIHPMRWTNALAYAQDPGFFRQNDYLAVYHIDRKTFPQFNPD